MPDPRRSSRSSARLLAALTLAVGLAVGSALTPVGSAGPAHADLSEIETESSVTVTVAPVEAILDPAANSYEFSVVLENPRAVSAAPGQIKLDIAAERTADTAALATPFAAEGATTIASVDVSATEAESSQTVTIDVRRSDLSLDASAEPGVYRVQATYTPEHTDRRETMVPVSESTPIVWKGVGEATTEIALIVPFVLPANVLSMPNRRQLDQAVSGYETLLDAAEAADATLAIDPRIIAGIRAFGDAASQQARSFLERLEATPQPSFLLQFADADPAAQAALGYDALLQPVGLEYITRQGSFPQSEDGAAVGEDLADGDAADADDDDNSGDDGDDAAAAEPTLEELLAWPQGLPLAWPAEGQADSATLTLLEASGITGTVLASGNVELTGGPRTSIGPQSVLVADDALRSSVSAALTADTDAVRQAADAQTTARLALAAQNDAPAALLALDRGSVADATDTTLIIDSILELPWVSPIPTTDLAEGTATLRSSSPLEERRELLRSSANQESNVDAVSALLEHPEDLLGYQRARLLNLFATRYASPEADFTAVAEHYAERDVELERGVTVISTEHTQLVGTSTRVPIQLHNSLPFTANVTLQVAPQSAALSLSERAFPEIRVGGEGNSSVLVPVRSRVSSGESGLTIEITDASGEWVSESSILPLSIRSSFETIGLWFLGVAAALLLVFGTVRSLRHRRAATSEGRDTAASESARVDEDDSENARHFTE